MPASVAPPSPSAPLGLRAPIRAASPASRASARTALGPVATAASLATLVAGALVLRLALTGRSLWFDEFITVQKAGQSLSALVENLADDVHPPLYYVLLHAWMDLLGHTPLAVRGLSIAWSAVTIVAVWGWSREAFPRTSGLPAATLAAFAPFSVWYATEARMYAQIFALTALAGWLAWRTFARGPQPLTVAALTTTLVALALTHYFALLFVGSLGVVAFVLFLTRRSKRTAAAWVATACVGAVASLLPWLAFVAVQRSPASPSPTVYPAPDVFSVLISFLEMVVGFQGVEVLGLLAAGWPLLGLLALVLVPAMGRVAWPVAGLLTVLALPAASLVLVSLVGPRSVFDPRFLAVCVVPLYLLLGQIAETRGRGLWRGTGAAAVVALVSLAVVQNTSSANRKLYDFDGAMAVVNARAEQGDGLLLLPNFTSAGLAGDPVSAYYPPRPGLRVVNTTGVGQVDPQATRRALGGAWAALARSRPARIFVIDAFAANPKAIVAASAARTFLQKHTVQVARVDLPQMTVHILVPEWGPR